MFYDDFDVVGDDAYYYVIRATYNKVYDFFGDSDPIFMHVRVSAYAELER